MNAQEKAELLNSLEVAEWDFIGNEVCSIWTPDNQKAREALHKLGVEDGVIDDFALETIDGLMINLAEIASFMPRVWPWNNKDGFMAKEGE